ncbi:MAG: linear amide C-N hydrolase [Merdibacter sp.]
MANVASGQPLYAEAMNEHGLYMAGLNFPGMPAMTARMIARYHAAPYELIP